MIGDGGAAEVLAGTDTMLSGERFAPQILMRLRFRTRRAEQDRRAPSCPIGQRCEHVDARSRRRPRSAPPIKMRIWGAKRSPGSMWCQCRRALQPRRRHLSFRQISLRAGHGTAARSPYESGRMSEPGASASRSAGRAGDDPLRGQASRCHAAPAEERRATAIVLMTMGLDSTKEELLTFELDFLRRGMAILAFDGPGQGEAEYDFPIRYDYETVVAPVIDWLAPMCAMWMRSASASGASVSAAIMHRARPRSRNASVRQLPIAGRTLGRAVGQAAHPDTRRLHPPQPQRDRSGSEGQGLHALARRYRGQNRVPVVRYRGRS